VVTAKCRLTALNGITAFAHVVVDCIANFREIRFNNCYAIPSNHSRQLTSENKFPTAFKNCISLQIHNYMSTSITAWLTPTVALLVYLQILELQMQLQ